MANNELLKKTLLLFPELESSSRNLIKEEIEKHDLSKANASQIESMISKLNENQKQKLLEILKNIK